MRVRAAILSRLCDQLLDCVTIRAEIDRRERSDEWVAGKGGKGGAFPVMTEEERAAAEEKVSARFWHVWLSACVRACMRACVPAAACHPPASPA